MFVLGITVVNSNSIERDVALKAGQSALIGDYLFQYQGGGQVIGPNYDAVRGSVRVTRAGRTVTMLYPEKRHYWVQGAVQTKAAIAPAVHRDLLATLGDDVGGGAWSMRFQYRPMVRLIWLGGIIMALGGLLAVVGRRQRGPAYAQDSVAEVSGRPAGALAVARSKGSA